MLQMTISALTLELSGSRQRLRLNDLLYAPLILTLNLCFDLFGTEPAEHYCPVCTAQLLIFATTQNQICKINNLPGNTAAQKK